MSTWSRRHFFTLAAAATAASGGLKPREGGTPSRPLPFDSNYRPKPLYSAIAEAFRTAPAR